MPIQTNKQLPPEVSELLAQLKDIHTPPPIGWWPPAPGWWILTLICIAALIALAIFTRRFLLKQRKKNQLMVLLTESMHSQVNSEICQNLNQLLKRFIRTRYQDNVNHLSGEAWVNYLHSKVAGKSHSIDLGCLGASAYQANVSIDKGKLEQSVREWIRLCL